ncbi:DNA-formamidopyrimidine glycosylase [Candidatus Woesebacteria bacterium RBG_13_34_9]|uniref:DNA-formamidopyrimidine glycosylase n=1 Tax=Candidatus Woesebacteria bacterium RBG_13_34_9 TaxID=1802477 RepID=A0A1F7X068_9BACT|nr:MAG: DNA-formamidopyrimidine glycosylase [Candidatus Woesebacteria bacterium RBG_13_34_9]
MPELPEVESIKLQLQKYLLGHRIEDIVINYTKIFNGDKTKAIGTKVLGIRRFGKALVFDLDNAYSIVIQIKLTGQLIYRGLNLSKANLLSEKILGGLGGKHTHVVFKLDKGGTLYYNDVRKFGRILIAKSENLKAESQFLSKLGAEFLSDMTMDKFSEILKKSSQAIKVLLMDQTKMVGVGNIYANDALFHAKIKPQRKAESLKREEIEKLFNAVESVLKEGIKRGGASEQAYVTPDGSEGSYQDFTLVYGRENELCKNNCGERIKKIKLGGRGTYFCPKCQR